MDVGLERAPGSQDGPRRVAVQPQPTVLLSPTSPRPPGQAPAHGGPPHRTTSLLLLSPALVLLAERPASGPVGRGPAAAAAAAQDPATATPAGDPQPGALLGGGGGGAGGMKAAIPAMSVPLAVLCLLLNIILPGSGICVYVNFAYTACTGRGTVKTQCPRAVLGGAGTVLSAISLCCCAAEVGEARVARGGGGSDAASLACLNLWVGVSQLLTVTFLLVGWLWSVTWGVAMVVVAAERRRKRLESKATEAGPNLSRSSPPRIITLV
uniref:Uncharacterized protein LOC116939749 n=1 Tax=Petromyzon marinus TaxID=7757 RepID=A0AAJ7SRQ5_PETMA|nr:uncharacterized protein LOC116939749 [Petromyzon marinus]